MTTTADPTVHDVPEDAFPLETQALLLDMDGTLIDSGPSVERAWSTMLREFGCTADFGHAMHGRPAQQVLGELLPELDEEPESRRVSCSERHKSRENSIGCSEQLQKPWQCDSLSSQ